MLTQGVMHPGRRGHHAPFMERPYIPVALVLGILIIVALCLSNAIRVFRSPFPGFFYYPNLIVSVSQRDSWDGPKAGLAPLDVILRVNGETVLSSREFREKLRSGASPLIYTLLRHGETLSFSVSPTRMTTSDFLILFLLPFLTGLFFLTMGSIVYIVKPQARASRVHLFLCSLIALFYIMAFDANTTHWFFRLWIAYPLFGAASIHLFLIFPREHPLTQRFRWIVYIPYLLALPLILAQEAFFFRSLTSRYLFRLAPLFMGLAFLVDLGLLIKGYFASVDPIIRRKTKVLVLGLLLASSFAVFWSFAFPLARIRLPLEYAVLLSILFPLFMAYAILRHNLFDIDFVIQTSLTYGTVSGILVGIYFLTVGIVSLFTQAIIGHKGTPLETIVFTLIAALAFYPLRQKVQSLIRRLFYPSRYDFRKTLLEFAQGLSTAMDLKALSRLLTHKLSHDMGLTGAVLYSQARGNRTLDHILSSGCASPEDLPAILPDRTTGLFTVLEGERKAIAVEKLLENGNLSSDERDGLQKLGMVLFFPLMAKGKLLGLLGLGRKLSGDTFVIEDLDILGAIARQAGMALENALLYEDMAQRERLASLGQVASIIIHEVKNPLGIIKVSAGTVKKWFSPRDKGYELATIIEDEVGRMNTTIKKLLTFAKAHELKMGPCQLNEVIRQTVKMCEPDLLSSKISSTLDLDGAVGDIPADAELLHQVFLNLILNAKLAMPEGGRLIISTRRSSHIRDHNGHGVEIFVKDTGVGIPQDMKERVFEPFFTTREGGTGLGLAIIKQIISDHKGSISVDSAPGQGTLFIIKLPSL